jgi:phosphoglycolate phosphatase
MVRMTDHLPQPHAILFDWDNTLVDTWPLIHRALNMTLRHMGHPEWSLEKVKSDVKKSMRDSFPDLFGPRWEEAGEHYLNSYKSLHLTHLEPLPGAEDMLRAIPDDIFVGVVSNKRGPTLRQELAHLGWKELFDVAIGSDDAERDKPHPAPVILALKEFRREFGPEVWFVGDTIVDLECAAATGTTPILYGDFDLPERMYEGFPFAAQVRNHAALKRLILSHLPARAAG